MKTGVVLMLLLLGAASCGEDDKEVGDKPQLLGVWRGENSEVNVRYGIIPLYDDEDEQFDVSLEFREDGSVIYTDDMGAVTNGTYSFDGTKLTTNVDFQDEFPIDTVTFDVVELTDSRLRLEMEQDQEVEVQGYGTIMANVRANASFTR